MSDICEGDGCTAGGEKSSGCEGDAGSGAGEGNDLALEGGHDEALSCNNWAQQSKESAKDFEVLIYTSLWSKILRVYGRAKFKSTGRCTKKSID